MEKVESSKSNKIIKSALFLTIAGFVTKIIGVLYKVPLLEIVGSEGLGYYQLVFPVFVFALILSSGGITTTLSKIIAKSESLKEKQCYFRICLYESLLISCAVSLLLIIFSKKISYFQGEIALYSSYKILSLALISVAITSSIRGYFQGMNNMKYTAWSQLIEQVGKIALGLMFSFLFIKTSVVMSIYGAFLGLSLAEVISTFFLIVVYKIENKNKLQNQNDEHSKLSVIQLKKYFKTFNKELLPITLTALISPLFSAINSVLIIDLLNKAGITSNIAIMLFGLSGVVVSLVGIPQIVSSALSTTIFPLICSKEKTENEKNKIIKFSYKLIFAICIPCVFVFLIFSKPIVSFLYSTDLSYGNINQLEIASHILKIVSSMVIYSSLSSFTTALLQAYNKSFKACQNILFGSIITLLCFIFFVKNAQLNILGDSLSTLIGLAVTVLLNLKELSKTNYIKINFKNVLILPLLCSSIMILIMQLIYKSLSGVISAKIVILFACCVGFIVYCLLIFALKVFNLEEISLLKPVKQSKSEAN